MTRRFYGDTRDIPRAHLPGPSSDPHGAFELLQRV